MFIIINPRPFLLIIKHVPPLAFALFSTSNIFVAKLFNLVINPDNLKSLSTSWFESSNLQPHPSALLRVRAYNPNSNENKTKNKIS